MTVTYGSDACSPLAEGAADDRITVIGILGGTFDPVHHGHLRLALDLHAALALERVYLVPAGRPVHRLPPVASVADRLAMLRIALRGVSELALDDRETRPGGPAYSVETLESFRRDLPRTPLVLLVGMDQVAVLDTWRRWQELLELGHLAIAGRPGTRAPLAGPVASWLDRHRSPDSAALGREPAGRVVQPQIPHLDISSSRIRAMLREGRTPRFLLPPEVLAHIEREELYLHAQ